MAQTSRVIGRDGDSPGPERTILGPPLGRPRLIPEEDFNLEGPRPYDVATIPGDEDPCRGSCWWPSSPPRAAVLAGTAAVGDHEPRYRPLGDDAHWTTVLKTTVGLEGLTSDRRGNLYTPGRGADPCPILRTTPSGGAPVVVGNIAAPCNPAGLAFDRDGNLLVADTARGAIWRVAVDHRGRVRSPTGCDTTFTPNTLCLDTSSPHTPSSRASTGSCSIAGQHHRRRQRAQCDRRGDRRRPLGRAVPQSGRADAAAQHRPARVPDQPG